MKRQPHVSYRGYIYGLSSECSQRTAARAVLSKIIVTELNGKLGVMYEPLEFVQIASLYTYIDRD